MVDSKRFLTKRILGGERVSTDELRKSEEPEIVEALGVCDNPDTPMSSIGIGGKAVHWKIKDWDLHGEKCPCDDCQKARVEAVEDLVGDYSSSEKRELLGLPPKGE